MKMSAEVKKHLLHFDNGFSPEIIEFATNEALKSSKYLIVTTIKNQQYGYCTHCNVESPTHLPKLSDRAIAEREMCGCPAAMYMGEEYERKKHGEKVICPNCKSKCTVRYSGLGHSNLRDYAYFVYYEKSRINPQIIVARGINTSRYYGKSYKNVETILNTEVYYTFEYKKMGKMIKPISTSWNDPYHLGFAKTVHSPQNPYTYCCCSRDSIAKAVKDTAFAWSGWENYDYKGMAEYFDLISRYPVIEYLNKLGFKKIVSEKLETGSVANGVINWHGKSIESVFRLTKEEFNILKQNKIEITSNFLNVMNTCKNRQLDLTLLEIADLSSIVSSDNDFDRIVATFEKYFNFKEAFKYCMKQKRKNPTNYSNTYRITNDWTDYVSECKKLNMDISDMRVLFPNDLHKAHQNTTKQIRYEVDKALTEKIIARLPELSHLYVSSEMYFIRPAENSFEIVNEGRELQHCVGRYAKDHAEGKTCILFIRKAEEPDKPFFTAEVKDSEIVQVRGYENHSPEDEMLLAFIEKFKKEALAVKKPKKRQIKNKIPA
jgi:hypothetical protein